MDVIQNFNAKFHEEIITRTVLIEDSVSGAAVLGDMLMPSVNFIASINEEGLVDHTKGRLEWLVENNKDRRGYGYPFSKYQICTLKLRRNIHVDLEPYMSEVMNNRYMVVEIIDEQVDNPLLEAIKVEMSKPVFIKEDFGTFELNRKYGCFSGSIQWGDSRCSVSLENDIDNNSTATNALSFLKQLLQEQEAFDQRVRTHIATSLLSLANDWAEDGVVITFDDMYRRVMLSELIVYPTKELVLYYNDDDIFLSHAIEVSVNSDGSMRSANLAG